MYSSLSEFVWVLLLTPAAIVTSCQFVSICIKMNLVFDVIVVCCNCGFVFCSCYWYLQLVLLCLLECLLWCCSYKLYMVHNFLGTRVLLPSFEANSSHFLGMSPHTLGLILVNSLHCKICFNIWILLVIFKCT